MKRSYINVQVGKNVLLEGGVVKIETIRCPYCGSCNSNIAGYGSFNKFRFVGGHVICNRCKHKFSIRDDRGSCDDEMKKGVWSVVQSIICPYCGSDKHKRTMVCALKFRYIIFYRCIRCRLKFFIELLHLFS